MAQHNVKIGDTIIVQDHAFVVVMLEARYKRPAVLTVMQPIELAELIDQ